MSKFKSIMEAMDELSNDIQTMSDDITDMAMEPHKIDYDSLVEELNKLFTPVLVTQSMEKDISDQVNIEISEATVLTERNIISFDDPARMAQLIATAAKLIAKQKNSQQWQIFKKASEMKKQSSIAIQKEEYDEAKILAEKYLIKVSTTNNSSVARDAANTLLPHTQN